jgi:hypothetical protein
LNEICPLDGFPFFWGRDPTWKAENTDICISNDFVQINGSLNSGVHIFLNAFVAMLHIPLASFIVTNFQN